MRSRALTLIAAASMLAVGLVAPTAAATPSSSPALNATIAATSATSSRDKVTSNKKKHKKIEKHVVRLVNKARTKAGLDKVKRRAAITKVARKWSVEQAKRGQLAHNPSFGSQLPSGWTRASENVAWTSANMSAKKLAKRMVQLWLDSPGHRANILDPHMSTTGVGVARSKRHGWYFTQNFSG